jgi:hypothetical protein
VALKQWLMHRRTRAKRQTWRRMDAQARPIRRYERLGLCLATVVLAGGVLMLFNAHQPAAKLLHRSLPGVALLFALLLAGGFALSFHGWLGRSLLAIPVGALMSYAAAPIAFHAYFLVFETATWRQLAGAGLWNFAMLTVAVWPSFLFAWLVGAVAAGLYLAAAMVLELRGIAVTLPETIVPDEIEDQGNVSPSAASTRATAGRDAMRSESRDQAG